MARKVGDKINYELQGRTYKGIIEKINAKTYNVRSGKTQRRIPHRLVGMAEGRKKGQADKKKTLASFDKELEGIAADIFKKGGETKKKGVTKAEAMKARDGLKDILKKKKGVAGTGLTNAQIRARVKAKKESDAKRRRSAITATPQPKAAPPPKAAAPKGEPFSARKREKLAREFYDLYGKHYYTVLGFSKNEHPNRATVKKVCHKLSRASHPDKGGTHEMMLEVNAACHVYYDSYGDADDPVGDFEKFAKQYAPDSEANKAKIRDILKTYDITKVGRGHLESALESKYAVRQASISKNGKKMTLIYISMGDAAPIKKTITLKPKK